MRTSSRLLRGYITNNSFERLKERHFTAPSETRNQKQKKNREGGFSNPSQYELPTVYRSKRGK